MGNLLNCLLIGRRKRKQKTRLVVPNHLIDENTPPKLHPNHGYLSNRIKTTKYTLLSFLPKNLFEQFHRFANLYFIFIILLNWIPQVNAFAKEVAMIPVLFVLGVTAVKDAFEDYRRYCSDKKINHLLCRKYSCAEKRYTKTLWQDIEVGDMLHLSCNEVIPADMVLLQSSEEHGTCYIDTSNLDGETNLKQRQVVKGIDQISNFDPGEFQHRVVCENPNIAIYKFHGSLISKRGDQTPLNVENLLLRGCIVRNTDFIEGLVVYAGHESKALMNNRGPRSKRSKLERQINKDVIWCVFWLVVLCLACALGSGLFLNNYPDITVVPFLAFTDQSDMTPSYQGFIRFWTYVILFQVMIPLSLYVTIEVVKLGQVYFIHQDRDLYYAPVEKGVECRALNITEDLGQVQYIFSDKTGTLTENKMVFKKCSIGGVDYSAANEDSLSSSHSPTIHCLPGLEPGQLVYNQQLCDSMIIHPSIQTALAGMTLESTFGLDLGVSADIQRIQEFFLLLVACNTVVVSPHDHKDKMDASGMVHDESFADSAHDMEVRKTLLSPPSNRSQPLDPGDSSSMSSAADSQTGPIISESQLKTRYEAESPDELALVKAACSYGCKLLRRTADLIQMWLPGKGKVELTVLHILPFDSHRKRMSVIVKHAISGQIILYCKGADACIMTNLKTRSRGNPEQEHLLLATQKHLDAFAKDGLRTLCMAKRVLTKDEYKSWLEIESAAENAIHNRERLRYEAACEIETEMELLGVTGIEDRLQDGVPETISALRQAGINMWVLTGDKQETALNIAYASKLISYEQHIIVLNARNKDLAQDQLINHAQHLEGEQERHLASSTSTKASSKLVQSEVDRDLALVIDGPTLSYVLEPSLAKHFLSLCQFCSSVICCRATPLQKAAVVKLVRDKLKKMTLAIGDGANDVSMIQTADVGMGLYGQEGMQAVMSSDFAIPRYHFLRRLLLVHGHWCYDRLARMTLYMFYKNVVFIFMLLWYQMFSGFSGSIVMDDLNLIAFNLVYTSIPPLLFGVLDQCVPAHVLMHTPALYMRGSKGQVYRWYSYHAALLEATWESLVQFFIPYFALSDSSVGIWEFGVTCNAACVYTTLAHLALDTNYWHWLHLAALLSSMGLFLVFNLILDVLCLTCTPPANPYMVFQHTLSQPIHWLLVLLVVITALLPRYTCEALKGSLCPDVCMRARQNRHRHEAATGRDAQKKGRSAKIRIRNPYRHQDSFVTHM